MGVVESQETVWQLRAKVVVLSARHLFAHAGPDLGHEGKDRAKTEVSSLAALVAFRMLDKSTPPERGHTGVDILIEVKSFLRLEDANSGSHVNCVEEIGVTRRAMRENEQ